MNLQKPTKADRKHIQIDTIGMAIPKIHPARDSTYRAYVRRHPCAIAGRAGHACRGPIEAAHIRTTGFAIKSSDYSCIPLCAKAHRWSQHQHGWTEFTVIFDLNPWQIAFWLLENWHKMKRKESR